MRSTTYIIVFFFAVTLISKVPAHNILRAKAGKTDSVTIPPVLIGKWNIVSDSFYIQCERLKSHNIETKHGYYSGKATDYLLFSPNERFYCKQGDYIDSGDCAMMARHCRPISYRYFDQARSNPHHENGSSIRL